MTNLKYWFSSATPKSSFQARCQQFYFGWIRFKSNPIAMIGFFIILTLVITALTAPIITKGPGGELIVETKEGEGSEFIISIPTTN